jgi:hypothetical protein
MPSIRSSLPSRRGIGKRARRLCARRQRPTDRRRSRASGADAGGLADPIVPFCEEIDEVDELLTLTGLRQIGNEPKLSRHACAPRVRRGPATGAPWTTVSTLTGIVPVNAARMTSMGRGTISRAAPGAVRWPRRSRPCIPHQRRHTLAPAQTAEQHPKLASDGASAATQPPSRHRREGRDATSCTGQRDQLGCIDLTVTTSEDTQRTAAPPR